MSDTAVMQAGAVDSVVLDLILAELKKLLKPILLGLLDKLDALVDSTSFGNFDFLKPYIKIVIAFVRTSITDLVVV